MSSPRNEPQETILVVDDEDKIVQFVQDALEDEGYTVWTAFDSETAVKYDRIWGMDSLGTTETVTEHIKRIRRKLAQCDVQTEYISTVWGVGYKWEANTSI